VEIEDKVRVDNTNSCLHNREGVVIDFENLKLRDKNSLVLVNIKNRRGYDWFYVKELVKIE